MSETSCVIVLSTLLRPLKSWPLAQNPQDVSAVLAKVCMTMIERLIMLQQKKDAVQVAALTKHLQDTNSDLQQSQRIIEALETAGLNASAQVRQPTLRPPQLKASNSRVRTVRYEITSTQQGTQHVSGWP